MPTVRRLDRQASITALPGARRTAAETSTSQGAGVEEARAQKFGALANLGATGARIGASLYERIKAEEQQNADNTALLKASNKLAEWKAKRLYDPKDGAFAQKGEAAQPLPEQLRGEFDTLTGDISKELTPTQRAAFDKMRAQEWQQTDLQVRRHVYEQMQAFKAGELESNIANHVNAAQQAYLDPKMVGIELQKAVDAIDANGPALGMGAEQLEAKKRAIRSETHVGVIGNLLGQEKTEAAKVYFEGVKSQIDGKVLDDVTKALDVGTDKKEAQKQFDAIRAQGGTWAEMRAAARKLEDPDQRDMVENYIDHEQSIAERDERETHKTMLRGAFDLIDAGKGTKGIPPQVWAQMDPDERRSAQIYAQAKAEGIPIKTDQTVFYKWMQMATNDPAAFIKGNILADRSHLSDSDLQQLAGLQVSLSNGDRVAAGKLLNDYRTPSQIVTQALTSARIDPSPDPTKEPEKAAAVANLNRMVAERYLALKESTGKEPSTADIQAITDDILQQQIEVPGSIFNWWKPTPKRLLETTIDDIPENEVERVRAFLKSKGLATTDDNVLGYWIDAKARMRGKK